MLQMQQAWDIADPRPHPLIEFSTRFRLLPESAIADLVDSSIPTGPRHIELSFEWNGIESSVVVSDDDCGIGETPLVSAMTLGSRCPTADWNASDLHKFGLGLKPLFSAGWEVAVVSFVRGGHAATRRRTVRGRRMSVTLSVPCGKIRN